MGRVEVSSLTIKKRLIFLFAVMALCVFGLLCRLAYIQIIQAGELQAKAWEQWNRSIPARSPRGFIYDRKERLLAGTASAESVVAFPAQIEDAPAAAKKMAEILNMEEDRLNELLSRRVASVYLQRQVEDDTAQAVRKLNIKGISLTQEPRRFYPNNNLAAQLLGFVGVDEGLSGLEYFYEQELKGRDGRLEFQTDGRGRQIPQAVQKFTPPANGHDLVLTIDQTIQFIMEREMERVMIESNPKGIIALAVDPNSGELLAVAGKPDFDPNNYADYPGERWKLSPVTNTYEPGSTFKIVTLAAALEENKFSATEGFFCSGSFRVGGHTIGCWTRSRGGHGAIDFEKVVLGSCNPGFITLGNRLGPEKQLEYLHAFGFGVTTGIDVPGESRGIIFSPSQMGPLESATTSFGQGVSVTPIQQVMAIAAVANGGKLMQPYVVKEIRDDLGNVVEKKEPKVVRRVISEETAREVTRIMELVVTEGSGINAYIEGYRIAGKTGTAQKVGPGGRYIPGEYILSFVGFAPAEDPQILLYIAVDAPRNGPQWGSQVTAPMFRKMMEDILKYMNIPSTNNIINEPPSMVEVPDLVNMQLEEANLLLENSGLMVKFIGQGDTILNQTPKPGARVPLHTQILIYRGGEDSSSDKVVLPDLSGKTMREAGEILSFLGLRMNASGSGVVIKQNPLPNAKLDKDTVVNVEFGNP